VPLAGTDDARFPFWAPDNRSVAFFAAGKLKRIDISGGPAEILCDAPSPGGGDWSGEGIIIFADGSGPLRSVVAAGGESKALLEFDKSRHESAHLWPRFLPDGRHFLYFVRSTEAGTRGVYLGALGSPTTRMVLHELSPTSYAQPGLLLFARQRTLMAQPFDLHKLQVIGAPSLVADSIRRGSTLFPSAAYFAVSDRALAYRPDDLWNLQLAWYSRDGSRVGPAGPRGGFRQISLAPDEKHLAVERIDPGRATTDFWLLELSSGILSRMTFDPGNEMDAVWSQDSGELVFAPRGKGRNNIYRKVVGGGEELPLLESSVVDSFYPQQWLRDESILMTGFPHRELYRLPNPRTASNDQRPVLLSHTEFGFETPHVSPDGRYIAYQTEESGRWEIYVAGFPSLTGKRQVSTAGGCQAIWNNDGKELFYLTLEGKLMAVDVSTANGIGISVSKTLFQTDIRVDPTLNQYSVTGHGKQFIMIEAVEGGETPIHVVLNWNSKLKP
jgi:hypothetical protein